MKGSCLLQQGAVSNLWGCLQDVPQIIKYCKAPGPVYLSALTDEELNLLDNMMLRLNKLGQAAAEVRCRTSISSITSVLHHISMMRAHVPFCCCSRDTDQFRRHPLCVRNAKTIVATCLVVTRPLAVGRFSLPLKERGIETQTNIDTHFYIKYQNIAR